MFMQLKGDDRSIRHDSVYLEIGRCVAAVARGMSIHDLECSSTIQMATAFIVGTRCWNKNWSDEAIWNLLDRWQRLAVLDHGAHHEMSAVAVDDTFGV